ncbi:MAG: glycosyltransferase family 2 protein [Chloroflexota bacterium]|nr:glycosyltransferase family 2 protein [Chloroflexota bacterium]
MSDSAIRLSADHPLSVSVIIPNWNGARYLPECLDSLRAQTYPQLEVIVVDNGSTDDSVALVKGDYPEVRLLELRENRGLTGGVNAGGEGARGDVLALLNNDALADPGWVRALVDGLERHPQAGIAASKMLLYDRPTIINSAGDIFGRDGIPGSRGVWEEDQGQYDQEEWVFGGCGGAVAYRLNMWEELGGFDEDFFMYCEDVDLNWRAQLAGYRCIYIPQAVVHHRLSATGGGVTASYYTGRNTIWVLAKDLPTSLWRKYWPRILGAQWKIAREALQAWQGKAARARLRGQLAGLLTWPRLWGKRQRVQKSRVVSDEYLRSILT